MDISKNMVFLYPNTIYSRAVFVYYGYIIE